MSGNKRRLSAADKKSIEEENAASAASLEQIKKDFEFCLCLTIVLPYSEPVVVQGCSHIFHRNCITTLLGEAASAECPQCRDRFIAVDIKELRSNQPIAWRMLQNLRVACPLECGAWKGDVSNLENHFETCGKTQCPLKCGAVIKPPATFEAHNTLCPKVILSCTNEGCEVQTTRASMPKHLSTCDHAIVECGWNICTHRGKRKDMFGHERNVDVHRQRDKMFVPPLISAKKFMAQQTVSIEMPSDLRMPTAEEQARDDPPWTYMMFPSVFFFVGPLRFELNAVVKQTGLLQIGPAIDDDRLHHIRFAFSHRLETNDGAIVDYRPTIYVELVNTVDRLFYDVFSNTVDSWLLKSDSKHVFKDNGKKSIRVNIRIYVDDFVLAGHEGPNPPTRIRELGTADGVQKGKKWGNCPFV